MESESSKSQTSTISRVIPDSVVCVRCKENKTNDQFPRNNKKRNGLASYCFDCKAKAQREYRTRNLEKCRRSEKKYSERNREYRRKKQAEYRKNNPNYRSDYAERNRTRLAEIEHRYRARKRKAALIPISPLDIELRKDYYGRKCWICSEVATAMDHVKPLAKGGPHILSNLRPICHECNSRKKDNWPITSEDINRWATMKAEG